MADNSAGAIDWLPYDMDTLAAIELACQQQPTAEQMEVVETVQELPKPEERDVLAVYNAFNLPVLTPEAMHDLIEHPYEERDPPGKTRRARKNPEIPSPSRKSFKNFTVASADPTSVQEIMRDTQQKLTASQASISSMQRQLSRSLELLRSMSLERDSYKEQLKATQDQLAASQEQVAHLKHALSSSHSSTPSPPPQTKLASPKQAPQADFEPPVRQVGGWMFKESAADTQHKMYDRMAELAARTNTTDEEYSEAVRDYCAASVRQNFICRDEIDAVCTVQFLMRNLALNYSTIPYAEPGSEGSEPNLQRWGEVMKGAGASQEQFERAIELIYLNRRESKTIMEERKLIMTELSEFFTNKFAYFMRMQLGEEAADLKSMIRAAQLLSQLRANLHRFVDHWNTSVYTHFHSLFTPRQMTLIYLQTRRHVITATDALVAVTQLAQQAESALKIAP